MPRSSNEAVVPAPNRLWQLVLLVAIVWTAFASAAVFVHRWWLLVAVWALGLGGIALGNRLVGQQVARRRQAVARLRESEERLEMALRGAELGVWDWDLTDDSVIFDERWAAMLGHELADLPQTLAAWSERVHPDDLPAVRAILDEHLAGRTPGYRAVFRMRRRTGEWIWILDTGKVLTRDASGRPLRAVGVHQDITAQKHAEAAREEALGRFRALVGALQMGVFVEDGAHAIVEANQSLRDMFGLDDPATLLGTDARRLADVIATRFRDAAGFRERERRIRAGGRVVAQEELELADGRVLERDYVPVISDGSVDGGLWVYRDITARKRQEREALHQERLAAVGQLSAGVAHDFNNILCSIMGFTELMQSAPETPVSLQPNLRRIGESSRRAAHLVKQILDFSQKTLRQVRSVDLEACLRETEIFLRASLPETIRIELDVAPGPYTLDAEPVQLQQMITNLAINARDAMPEGGELRLSLSRGEVDDPAESCALCGQPLRGEWLRLEVADTGLGIADDVMPHIFEPFFTTRRVGEGTGLGLSQAVGIVAQHGGHLRVRTAVGHGTTFTILLPPGVAHVPTPAPDVRSVTHGAGRHVLLVEDDLSVGEAIAAMLRRLDYRVTVASSGREALDVFARADGRFDLVLTDVVMPDLDGEALCARLRALSPAVRIAAMSGYPLHARGAGLFRLGVTTRVEKPVSIEQLAAAVAEALATPTG